MDKMLRGVLLLAAMVTAGAAASVARAPTAEAQGMEYCPDLGVLVQHSDGGMFVRAFRGGSLAREIGLQRGDLVFSINGNHPDSLDDLHRVLFTGADNEDHDLDILRNGRHLHAMVFHDHGHILVHSTLH